MVTEHTKFKIQITIGINRTDNYAKMYALLRAHAVTSVNAYKWSKIMLQMACKPVYYPCKSHDHDHQWADLVMT